MISQSDATLVREVMLAKAGTPYLLELNIIFFERFEGLD